MRAVLQRVIKANVSIDKKIVGSIEKGLVVLLGIEVKDNVEDIEWLSMKILNLRIFNDENGLMNKSILDVKGNILLISQFTLFAQTNKGNRPSYIKAAKPSDAMPIYEDCIKTIEKKFGKKIQKGVFGADMQVELVNDGPVTIVIDTKNKE